MNLSNIQLDNQKKILIVIFGVLIAYVDLNYILKSQTNALKNLGPKIERIEKDLANLNRNLENMRISKNKLNTPDQKDQAKTVRFVSEHQISGLLRDISNQANKLSIKIFQIRPSRDLKSAKPGDKSSPYLINLDLEGDYHNLGKLVSWMENYSVFMEVQELRIEAQDQDYMKQKINLIIKTYVSQ